MSKFDKVQDYFQRGLWSKAMARNAVVKGWISAAQFQQITGETY